LPQLTKRPQGAIAELPAKGNLGHAISLTGMTALAFFQKEAGTQ
jgi:hypothetical protein